MKLTGFSRREMGTLAICTLMNLQGKPETEEEAARRWDEFTPEEQYLTLTIFQAYLERVHHELNNAITINISNPHRMKETTCPGCHEPIDALSVAMGEDKLTPNMLGICAFCGSINQLDENFKLVKAREGWEEDAPVETVEAMHALSAKIKADGPILPPRPKRDDEIV